MKTYDEYIQARIMKVYLENKKGKLYNYSYKTFDELIEGYIAKGSTADWLFKFGCGRQRAKDYAHYIKNYLATTVKS
jgi:hypothetical protein